MAAGFDKRTIWLDRERREVSWLRSWLYPLEVRKFETLEAARAYAFKKLATKAFASGCIIES